MRRRLDRRRAQADELAVARQRAAEGVERCKEQMQAQIERVLPLSRALAAAHRQVQVPARPFLPLHATLECVLWLPAFGPIASADCRMPRRDYPRRGRGLGICRGCSGRGSSPW
uniref:Uncharacterized protein n=1 Tax=Aegilops tauschii subsp. strangulata TaxID=200361 RepID=A0A452ZE31_AEGTS